MGKLSTHIHECPRCGTRWECGENTPQTVSRHQPRPLPIATGVQRISRDKQMIEISRGNQSVAINYFTELVVATMTDDKAPPEKLIGETICLERHPKKRDHWNIFLGCGSDGDAMVLPENVFRIQSVLASTATNQVKVQVDGQVYRLRPGEILLLLG